MTTESESVAKFCEEINSRGLEVNLACVTFVALAGHERALVKLAHDASTVAEEIHDFLESKHFCERCQAKLEEQVKEQAKVGGILSWLQRLMGKR